MAPPTLKRSSTTSRIPARRKGTGPEQVGRVGLARRSAVTDISPKAVLVGVLLGTGGALAWGFVSALQVGRSDDGALLRAVLWLPAGLVICLMTGGLVGAMAAVFFCALRNPRRRER